jgi:hypothetical protein
MKKPVLISIILLVVLIIPNLLMAQPGAPPDDPNDVLVPLDGGLSILLGAAVAYGSDKIKERRKG